MLGLRDDFCHHFSSRHMTSHFIHLLLPAREEGGGRGRREREGGGPPQKLQQVPKAAVEAQTGDLSGQLHLAPENTQVSLGITLEVATT